MSKAVAGGADSPYVRILCTLIPRHISLEGIEEFQADFWRIFDKMPEAANPANRDHANNIMIRACGYSVRAGRKTSEQLAAVPPLETIDVPGIVETTSFDMDTIMSGETVSSVAHPMLATDGPFYKTLMNWIATKKFPLAAKIEFDGKVYVAVGSGKQVNPALKLVVNFNCTTANFRKIKDADETYIVHHNGRSLTLSHETSTEAVFHLHIVKVNAHTIGKVVRFWANKNVDGKNIGDDPRGNYRIRITPDGFETVQGLSLVG